MNIKINTITLEIQNKKLELTLQECEELYNILENILDKKPKFTISSQWPIISDGGEKVPYNPVYYPPYINPNIVWSGTNIGLAGTATQTNKDYTITATN